MLRITHKCLAKTDGGIKISSFSLHANNNRTLVPPTFYFALLQCGKEAGMLRNYENPTVP